MTTAFDTSKPNIARMYDYWLGGKDHFEADRRAAEAIRGTRPNVAEQALDNKQFQTRAVRYVASKGPAVRGYRVRTAYVPGEGGGPGTAVAVHARGRHGRGARRGRRLRGP